MSREPDFPPKDLPLRDDVFRLGALVGDVIAEQGGRELFERVEAVRRSSIAHREGKPEADRELEGLLGGRSTLEATGLVRAFATYFQVVNIAERVHRIRRARSYLVAGAAPQTASLAESFRRLADAGVDIEAVGSMLERASLDLVFTSHPSQATRRTILDKHRRIARTLLDRGESSWPASGNDAASESIRTEVTAGWQTEEYPAERPTVHDEMDYVLFHLAEVIWRVIPDFYESLDRAIADAYGRGPSAPIVVRFASWVGGDMDGNPNVDAGTIRAALERHRRAVIALYRAELGELYERLSQSSSRVDVSGPLKARSRDYASQFAAAGEDMSARHRNMPYRVFLRQMDARLAATLEDSASGYGSVAGFVEDLELISSSLESHGGRHAGRGDVVRALCRARTFGFHLATLDIRQNASVHRDIVGPALGFDDWPATARAERVDRIRKALASEALAPPAGADTTLEVFRAIDECRERYGDEAIGPYIVSMTEDIDDVLSVLLLARWARGGAPGPVQLDVAPLFETAEDLERAGSVMAELLADPPYRAHVAGRGDRQVVMVGYSDSNKGSGLVASRWLIHRAQSDLAAEIAKTGVELTVFHGRGGTAGRGGGKTHRALMASPAATSSGRVRVTEQGETISEKYGLRGIAMRNLEQAFGAVALAAALPPESDPREAGWREAMTTIAESSLDAYRALVHRESAFTEYFRRATPIDVIERMRIGSRPARRRENAGIDELRAIPWVFAWTQSRHLLPGWYGLGAGLEAAVDAHGEDRVAVMVREWPFLRTVVDDAEMVLAKADMEIAARYATLAGPELGRIFDRIRSDYDRTVEILLRLKGTSALLDEDPALQRSILLRNPYVDPMSFIQVDLLARWRETGRKDEAMFRSLLATVGGIAQGLQNTG